MHLRATRSRITRAARTTTALIAAATLSLGVAACSDDSDDSASSDDSSLVETEGEFPQTVSTAFGDVTVEEQPQRVVALGWGDAETALALGVQPVGASDWGGFGGEGLGPWIEESGSTTYENAPEIIDTREVDYEAVAALEPDLILDVKSSGDQDRYDKLSDIATTVGIPDEDAGSFLTGPDEQTTSIATALGLPEKGEELNEDRAEKYAEISEAHPDWEGQTVSAIGASDTWGVFLEGSARVDPFLKLGFTLNEKISAADPGPNGFSVSLSDENLSDADSDVVLAFPIGKDAEEIESNSAWQRLEATKDGRSFVVPDEVSSAISLGSPQAYEYALDELVGLLEEHTS
ncbi:MAG TPA: iron-siderophore ABC transporter substrate-binding protein [Candidatus Corynebacterium avicola]|uniref:Iron-siderophore ABC transporter substrate-binding protein n=1 Tax=Candidatus Corynebacterium avicola TaxID=2838527 RepID=A0A9D1RR64_9CORY|nr:iron-siderophore ABC transporter substrate-binding protein [Candidatus Corynebacterium avicola]